MHPRVSAAITEGGLFVEIAQECRAILGSGVQLAFVCGRDAAERMVTWDYGEPRAIESRAAVSASASVERSRSLARTTETPKASW